MGSFKKTAKWTGIVVTGLIGVVLLGGGKVQSGTLLILMAFILARPVKRHRLPLWVRIVLICAVFGAVALNISTTQLPNTTEGVILCGNEVAYPYTPTGFKFLDQVNYIFSGFLAQAAPS